VRIVCGLGLPALRISVHNQFAGQNQELVGPVLQWSEMETPPAFIGEKTKVVTRPIENRS